ncbi:MAG: efflux RND transporter periplasmic adaptor subunit [Deltaproteobacteria bacterium]|nr:efflux RND transporter periplasmic adaptor subunit [Deltaproteobacteria bacterium]
MKPDRKTRNDSLMNKTFRAFPGTVLVLFVLMLLLVSCGKEEEQVAREVVRPVKMMTVTSGGGAFTRAFPGKVQASQQVDLAFKVSGPLTELPVKEGQEVKKGALLARILPRDFNINLQKAKALALEAEQQYKRYKALYVQKQVSKADFDKYKSARDVAKAEQENARHALNDTYLRAPFSGSIAKKHVDNFQEVRAKQPIVSLQDLSSLEIRIDVPESIIAKGREKDSLNAVAEFSTAPGKQYKLSLKEYSTQAGSRTQAYEVTFLMPQPEDINVLPGMTANVVVTTSAEEGGSDKIIIPAIAVFADEAGNSNVWIVDQENMTVKRQKVTTGDLTGTESIGISEGLRSGDMIAISGVTQLREGMQVRPMGK